MRILIADDHDIVRLGLKQLLVAQPGWEVCAEATTGEEAVTLPGGSHTGGELAIERQKVRTVLEWLQAKPYMPNDADLLFECPRCRWWIPATHASPEPLTKLQLDETMFDLRCDAPDCGWTGQLTGRKGAPAKTVK
jgi:hypothetical protein